MLRYPLEKRMGEYQSRSDLLGPAALLYSQILKKINRHQMENYNKQQHTKANAYIYIQRIKLNL